MGVKEDKKEQKNGVNKTAILVALILGISVLGFGLIQYLDERSAEQVETERVRLELESQRREQESVQREQRSREATMAACHKEAEDRAQDLLKTKGELYDPFREAAEKDLYLEPDYEALYSQCLRRNGVEQ